MATRTTTPAPKQSRTVFRSAETQSFGKTFNTADDRRNTKLFDPALPEDQMMRRSLAPWVAKTALWNLLQRGKGRDHKVTTKPLNKIQDTFLGVSQSNTAARKARPNHPGYDTEAQRRLWGERILGKPGDAYRRGLNDPNRPINDMTGDRVSPLKFNPRTQEYDR
jgi:hypothetical protein